MNTDRINYLKDVACCGHEFSERLLFLDVFKSITYTIDSIINDSKPTVTLSDYMSDGIKCSKEDLLDKVIDLMSFYKKHVHKTTQDRLADMIILLLEMAGHYGVDIELKPKDDVVAVFKEYKGDEGVKYSGFNEQAIEVKKQAGYFIEQCYCENYKNAIDTFLSFILYFSKDNGIDILDVVNVKIAYLKILSTLIE